MERAAAEIKMLLRQRHRRGIDREDDFRVDDPAAMMSAQKASTVVFAWLLASVASVSLIVGGISIMNIMLVSVTERTREIGLRLAVGARRRDISTQFLMEAVVLCLVGGLIGIVLGGGVSWAIAYFAGWPVFLGVDSMLLAIGFAAITGVFFGYYPAWKAARLEPIAALRWE
jgi:putative ABC transport system permease protein